MRRVDEAIRQVLADALAGELEDPRVGFVTVTDVRTSPDLRRRACTSACSATSRSARRRSRGCAARTASCSAGSPRELRLKRTPTLKFVYDETTDRALRVDALLRAEEPREDRRTARATTPTGSGRRANTAGVRPASRCCSASAATALRARHPREPRRRRARLARRDAGPAARARQGLADGHRAEEFPLPQEYRFFALDDLIQEPPADIAERTVIFLDCGNIDRNSAEVLRDGRAPAEHRPPPRQHALRHGQPRRRGRLLHRRDRLGPDARPRRRR